MRGSSASSPGRKAALSVGIVLLNRFSLTPFSLFLDALRLAADFGDRSRRVRCEWQILAPSRGAVTSSCGVEITPTATLRECDPGRFDYVVVVGGLLAAQSDERAVVEFLKRADRDNVRLVALCTATFLFVRAGLMAGRRTCVSWFHHGDFLEEFDDVAPVSDHVFIVDGPRITCAGGTAAYDVAHYIIERHLGAGIANKCRRILIVDRARGPIEPQPVTQGSELAPKLRRAILIYEANLHRHLTSEDVARRVGLSRRQLERLFRKSLELSPSKYLKEARLRRARLLVLFSDMSLIDIALECGFATASHFGTSFSACFGLSPSTARRQRDGPGQLGKLDLRGLGNEPSTLWKLRDEIETAFDASRDPSRRVARDPETIS